MVKKLVLIGRKYPEYHTQFETVDFSHEWPTAPGKPDIDYDLLRKIEIESSDIEDNGVK